MRIACGDILFASIYYFIFQSVLINFQIVISAAIWIPYCIVIYFPSPLEFQWDIFAISQPT